MFLEIWERRRETDPLPSHILISQTGPGVGSVAFTLSIDGTEHHTVEDLLFHFRLFCRFMFESCKLVWCWVNKHSTLKIIATNISKTVWQVLRMRYNRGNRYPGKGNQGKNSYDCKTEEMCSKDEIPGSSHAGGLHVQMPDGRERLQWNGFSSLFPLPFQPMQGKRRSAHFGHWHEAVNFDGRKVDGGGIAIWRPANSKKVESEVSQLCDCL